MAPTLSRRLLLIGKIAAGMLLIFFAALIGLGFCRNYEKVKTQQAVERITNSKITMEDVMGAHLPSPPDQQVNDATLAGIDANNNGIRDDVELAIFAKYPNSAKIRAAELQYSKELHNELSGIFNKDTWIASAKNENNGISCLVDVSFEKYATIGEQVAGGEAWRMEVESLVFNTDVRTRERNKMRQYETSFVLTEGTCDIPVNTLEN